MTKSISLKTLPGDAVPEDGQLREPLLNERQAAEILNISTRSLQGWRLAGRGPTFLKIGSAVRYAPQDVERFIAESRRTSTSVASAPA